MKEIYKKILEGEHCKISSLINDEMYYMMHALMKHECHLFSKEKRQGEMGHLPMKITIIIEADEKLPDKIG